MHSAIEHRLMEYFLAFGELESLDNPTKAAMRLCNKQIKAAIDATVVSSKVYTEDLIQFLHCNWNLKNVCIEDRTGSAESPSLEELKPSLTALPGKFPLLEKLECINLPELTQNIEDFSHLRTLRVKDEFLNKTLPPSVSQLTALETLVLCMDSLTREDLAPLKHLKQMKRLDIQKDVELSLGLPAIGLDWICNNLPTSLEQLLIIDNLQSLPASISKLNHLTSLGLFNLSEGEAPQSIGYLSLLQELKLSSEHGPIALPRSVSKLTALKNLSTTTNEEGMAPLQHLNCLTELDLRTWPEVTMEYPSFIWNLTSLKALCLNSGGVRSLPDAFGNLKNLERFELLYLHNIRKLPDSIGNLSSLTSFKISSCERLKRLPTTIGNLPLKSLSIHSCQALQSLPESLGALSLTNLKLEENGALTQLPSSIGNLACLESLKIYHCPLSKVPDSIGDLTCLKSLRISFCPLTKLPDSIGNLTSLESLILYRCPLTKLPDSIGDLNALRVLRINKCDKLTAVPESLGGLLRRKAHGEGAALERISFVDCEVLKLSPEIRQALEPFKDLGIYSETLDYVEMTMGIVFYM